jgi:hypothetical protein
MSEVDIFKLVKDIHGLGNDVVKVYVKRIICDFKCSNVVDDVNMSEKEESDENENDNKENEGSDDNNSCKENGNTNESLISTSFKSLSITSKITVNPAFFLHYRFFLFYYLHSLSPSETLS